MSANWNHVCRSMMAGMALLAIRESHVSAATPAPTPSITLVSPTGWAVYDPKGVYGQTTCTIKWSSKNVTGDVAIDISRDDGYGWTPLIEPTKNDGVEVWKVGGVGTAKVRLRIRTMNFPVAVVKSTKSFCVMGPYYLSFPGGYCTEYAARSFNSAAPSPGVNWTGDAGVWLSRAAGTFKTTTDPKAGVPGAAVVWTNGNFGHVGTFRSYTRDSKGQITHMNIAEQNWGNVIDTSNSITENYGIVTTTSLPITKLGRGTSYAFKGMVLPQKK